MWQNILGIALLAFVIWLGLRMGKRWSAIAVRLCLAGLIAASVVARTALAEEARLTLTVGLSAFAGALFLLMALGFVGPAIFKRWTFAAALSTALNVSLVLVPQPLIFFLFTGIGGTEPSPADW